MNRRLYVGNLAYTTTSEQLQDLFAVHGEVVEVKIITDRETGRSKGFSFIEMATDDGCRKAIQELDELSLDGRNIKVNEARERVERSPRSGFSDHRR
ncbi:MAG: RNA-binding protein [Candidatus Hatepunaea meridiana]|nr:RNA-binding protein [Candidatus Hatepunaea meridiana]